MPRVDVVGVVITDKNGIEHEYYNHERPISISVTHTEIPGANPKPCSYLTVVIPLDCTEDSYPS